MTPGSDDNVRYRWDLATHPLVYTSYNI